jgi:thiol-disulfide isomerase/thioredoxin
MSKLLTISICSVLFVFAGNLTTKEKVQKFLTTSIKPNKNIKVLGFHIAKVIDLKDIPGWKAYVLTIDIELLKQNNRVITIKDVIFSNGKYLSRAFVDIDTKKKLKDKILKSFSPDAPMSYYDDEHLLYGSKDAKYKVLVFSDPQCPFCMDFVPDLMEFVKKHPKDFALYYYHMPLSIHPGSDTIVKAEIAARKKGYKDISYKVYKKDVEVDTKDPKKVLKVFNKKLKTNITLDDIKNKDVEKRFSNDLYKANKILVGGTPTVYVNGKYDAGREKLQKLMDEYSLK